MFNGTCNPPNLIKEKHRRTGLPLCRQPLAGVVISHSAAEPALLATTEAVVLFIANERRAVIARLGSPSLSTQDLPIGINCNRKYFYSF